MIHQKVQCWIFSRLPNNEEICLLLLTKPERGTFWQPVTGSVEPNEGYFSAACREPFEETKFIFSQPPEDTGYEFEFFSRQGATKERIFGLYVENAPTPRLDNNEHQDFQWILPAKAIPHLKFPSNIEGLKKAYKVVFKKDLIC